MSKEHLHNNEITFAEGFEFLPLTDKNEKLEEILRTGESVNQILEAGDFSKAGLDFVIDTEMFSTMIKNFSNRVIGTDPPVDFSHDRDGEASGWIKDLFLDETGNKLFARIKWTSSGVDKLKGLEFRYLSASFMTRFLDGSTGKEFGPTLSGAALTNIPFLRHMPAVVDLSQKNNPIILEQRKDEQMSDKENTISLNDYNAHLKVLNDRLQDSERKVVELSDELANVGDIKDKNAELVKELADKNAEIQLKDREAKFASLLSEGKAVESQREAFINKDVDAFLDLSQPVNLKGIGHSDDPEAGEVKFSDLPKDEKDMFNKFLASSMSEEEYLTAREGKAAPKKDK